MRRSAWIVAVVLAALGGCRSAGPPAAPSAPGPAAASERAPQAAAPAPDPRADVEALLEAAQDAVADGDTGSFHDCEADVFRILEREPELTARQGDCPPYSDEVVEELVRLAEQAEASDEDAEEPPPEPRPVPEERVAEVQQKARLATYDLPVLVNPEVTSLIDFYTIRWRERFIAALERASTYLPYIRERLRAANLPQDLAWLPLVESAFNPHARSRARAQGLWQFIAGTARLYDLRCDGLVDERNDPYLATDAAVRHLRDLHAAFGSWELALAAYNCGPGNIQRAVRRARGETDFWTIRRYLRRETRNYVPALWAVVVVTKSPEAYGLPQFEGKPACLARVPVQGALDLDVLAERSGFDADELAAMNPALTRRLTPAAGTYRLAVPCGREAQVAEALAAIPPGERVRRFLHVVKRGDTPGAIARRYGSSADAILAANGIRNPRSLRVGQTLIVPRGGAAVERAQPAKAQPRVAAAAHRAPERYVVRRGDTLYKIARRFGTSTEVLQKRNNLPDTTIRAGDVLVLTR